MNNKKLWLVTGASKGLGLTLVKKLLATGYAVAATSRDLQSLIKEAGTASGDFLPLQVDLTNEQNVQDAITQVISQFGKIDVLVNNAGYGQTGTLEELSDQEARRNFDINVFGALNAIRHTMPYMRKAKAGHILNISSIGGFTGNFAGWGIYAATKFAMAGFTEALSAEIQSFGVFATIVYPGYFRTNFLAKDSIAIAATAIDEYKEARASEAAHQNDINGNQQGDPEKAADAMIAAANTTNPPLHLFLGQDAYDMANIKIAAVEKDLADWKAVTVATGFAD